MARSREELMQLGIFELRKIGMDIGVKLPTTFKKADLIEEIILVESRQKEPYVKPTKRGRPSKFVSSSGKLTSANNLIRYDYTKVYGLESCCKRYNQSVNTVDMFGVVDLSIDNNYVLVPLVTNKRHYFIHDSIVSRYDLKCGDLLQCSISCDLNDNYVVGVKSVNGNSILNSNIQRVSFEEEIDDRKEIKFEDNFLVSELFPIYQGDRVLLSSLDKKELLINTFKLVKNIASNNDVSIYVLLNNTNKKCISVFSQIKNVNVFASQFADSTQLQGNLIRLYFDSVNSACRTLGKNVVMVIEDFDELYKFYAQEFGESGALEKIKSIFIQAKNCENSSLTIIFGTQKSDALYNEFAFASSVNLVPLEMSEQDLSIIKYNLFESNRNELMFALENKLDSIVKKFCKGSNYMEKHKKLEQIAQNSSTCEEIYEKLLEIL